MHGHHDLDCGPGFDRVQARDGHFEAELTVAHEGLALSFSVAYLVSALLAFRLVSRRTCGLKERELLGALGRILVASAAMAGATKLAAIGAGRLFVETGAALRLPGRLGLIVEVGAAVTCGVTVYAVVGRLVGVTEFASVLAGLRRRIGVGR